MPITNDQIEQAFRIANEQLQVLRNSTPIHKGKTLDSILLRHQPLMNLFRVESRIDDQTIDIMITFKL